MDLFDWRRQQATDQEAPLAARMRPRTLDEYVGQDAILGPGRLLRRAIQADQLGSLIFYGPPGTGKTTLARVIANSTRAEFIAINAVLGGVKDIREAVDRAQRVRGEQGRRTILFVDEVHRFNKAQQDALLPWVENGTVILVGATTENPYFEVNKALVSRSRIFRLEPLGEPELRRIAEQALADPHRGFGGRLVTVAPAALDHLVNVANGDARALLNALELAVETTPPSADGQVLVDLAVAEESIQTRAVFYDKEGDAHFDAISAFIKSCRGGDPDAALYWLARMVHAGEDPRFLLRRLIILASEDVGLADPDCLVRVEACAAAFDRVGMPEGRYHLAQATLVVATAAKSNSIMGFFSALATVERERTEDVPDHLKDGNRDKEGFGHGVGYLYPHAYRDHWVAQQYLPAGLQGQVFYAPSSQGYEATIREQVIQRREAQLASVEVSAAEPLGLTTGPDDPLLHRFTQRALAGAADHMTAVRTGLFARAEVHRHHVVLELGARTGFLTWEALRQTPEGGVATWITEADPLEAARLAGTLREQVAALPELLRPRVFLGTLAEAAPSLDAEVPELRFDRVLAHDLLGGHLERLGDLPAVLAARLAPQGRVVLAEPVPRLAQRLSQLVPPDGLPAALHTRWRDAEEALHETVDARLSWEGPDLAELFEIAGFTVQVDHGAVERRLRVTARLLERWWDGPWGQRLAAALPPEDVDDLRRWTRARWVDHDVLWHTGLAWLVARASG
ncbi:MAG: AAA family ATPase [bacterium]